MAYSKQFIEDVYNTLPERFHVFFKAYRNRLKITEEDFLDFVQLTLEEKLESKTTKEKLAPVVRRVKKSFNNKSQYLYSKFCEYSSLDITDKKHPLHFLSVLPPLDFYAKYGDKNIEQVLSDYMEAVDVWRNELANNRNVDMEEKFLLIDFPVLDFIKATVLLDCFKIDITLAIWHHIETEMGGCISSYEFSTLQEFIDKPLWPSGPLTKKLDKTNDDLYEYVVQDENGQLLLTFQSPNEQKQILAEDGRVVIDYLINLLEDRDSLPANGEYEVSIRAIANQLTDYNANTSVLERAKNVFRYLYNVNYLFYDEDTSSETYYRREGEFRILSSLFFVETGSKESAIFEVSKAFQNEVIDRHLVSVKAKEYRLLENNLSRSIIHALKREQYLHANNIETWYEYDYSFFSKNVYFETANKKENMQLVLNSLREFKDKQIIIDDLLFKRDVFRIKFLPL